MKIYQARFITFKIPFIRVFLEFGQLAVEYDGKIDIYKVDVDQEPELEAAFAIRTIPNLLLCPMGGKPSMKLGTMNKTQLKALIEEVLL